MTTPALDLEQSLKQLSDARKLVLGDASFYPQIIQGMIPIISPNTKIELRRWGADFLAETFASPSLPAREKETLSLVVLDTIKDLLENPQEDVAVVKNLIQVAASVYPLVVRWIINNAYDTLSWERIVGIKTRILRIWENAPPGIRICCIKFAQRIVMSQTTGPHADPRRGDPMEVSLSIVPPNHTLLHPRNLEAEAIGLLDRMLAVFQENSTDPILVDATLNSLSFLIRSRPQTANKILNSILNFNPLKQANSPLTPKIRVAVKSMEKTTRMLLIHIVKRDPQNPLIGRIHQYIERMMRTRSEIFDETSRKRGHPEATDAVDPAKRQKLVAQSTSAPKFIVPPLSPGPHTLAELYTVTEDEALKNFDVVLLPEDLVVKIGITILQKLDVNTLHQAVAGIKSRLEVLDKPPTSPLPLPETLNPETALLGVDEEDDDYEPDFEPAEDAEQILNKLDGAPPKEIEVLVEAPPDVPLAPFTLPPPPPLTPEQATHLGQGTVVRVFGAMRSLNEPVKKTNTGINRLAASSYDRDAWITIITRLATRSSSGLQRSEDLVKSELGDMNKSVGDTIRENLYQYILEDFRKRIDIAVTWLCEEWYNDRIQLRMSGGAVLHYNKWVLKVLDGIVPYLDARDKILTRFLSEIPGLDVEALERVKGLCRDPNMVNLALTSLLYLVMFKPPVRELALDAVEDIWLTYEDARPIASKYLTKWRPGFTEQHLKAQEEKETEVKPLNGVTAVSA